MEEDGDFFRTGEGRGGARRRIIPQSERINPPSSSWFPLVPLSFLSSLGAGYVASAFFQSAIKM